MGKKIVQDSAEPRGDFRRGKLLQQFVAVISDQEHFIVGERARMVSDSCNQMFEALPNLRTSSAIFILPSKGRAVLNGQTQNRKTA